MVKKLFGSMLRRVDEALEMLTENPRPPGCVKLAGRDNEWRVRIGDLRIIYSIFDDKLLVLVISIGPRDAAYKGKG